jgi:hypothetical protein
MTHDNCAGQDTTERLAFGPTLIALDQVPAGPVVVVVVGTALVVVVVLALDDELGL